MSSEETISNSSGTEDGSERSAAANLSRAYDGPIVVGIGASANGLEPLEAFFEGLSEPSDMAFVVVQHLSPDFHSELARILQRTTSLEVVTAEDETPIETGHVYVISPGTQLSIHDRKLHTQPLPDLVSERHTIDTFFRSLGEECHHRSVGILLSGNGTDGTEGLEWIRQHGGLTMAQDPEEAGFESMPRSAIDAGVVDIVLPAGKLAARLGDIPDFHHRFGPFHTPDKPEIEGDESRTVSEILEAVRDHSGNDFSDYKRPTILRRIGRRMQVHDLEELEEYLRRLRGNHRELDVLFDELTIGVTQFFRDPEVWEDFRQRIVPKLFEGKSSDDQLRVWVPGCSTGEEVYTIAMLLLDHAKGLQDAPEMKIFATDLDDSSVESARSGLYPATIRSDVPPHLLDRYFEQVEDGYQINRLLRDRILFATHNVLADPPFRELDMVSCRNLLIYLNPEAQSRLLQLLHYGLRPGGYLLLGTSETVSQTPDLFTPDSDDHPIFRSVESGEQDLIATRAPFGFAPPKIDVPETETPNESDVDLEQLHRSAVIRAHAPASVLVNESYRLLHTIGDVGPYLSVPAGEATDNLLDMVGEDLRPRVRSVLFQAFRDDDAEVARSTPASADADGLEIVLEARRLEGDDFNAAVAELSFRTVQSSEPKKTEEEKSRPDPATTEEVVRSLERELDQTRRRLEATVADYETSNEKLRASNEELLSMNEELQSTTEELETSKEELQSMNEELTTVNQELTAKIEELDSLNDDLKNLLRSTDIGTIFLNRNLEIERFTDPVTEYFNILPSDLGRPVDHITHSLTIEGLADLARKVLNNLETLERETCTEDAERHLLFRALPYLSADDHVDGVVLTFFDITEQKLLERQFRTSERKFRTVFESAANPMFVYRLEDGSKPKPIEEVNARAVELTGTDRSELRERRFCDLVSGEEFDCDAHIENLAREGISKGTGFLRTAGDANPIPCDFTAKRMQVGDSHIVVAIVRDIRERKQFEEALVASRERAEELAELRSMFLSTLTHDLRSPLAEISAIAGVLSDHVDDEQLEYVRRIENSAERLGETLESIVRRASVETNRAVAEPEAIDLVEELEEAIDEFEARSDENQGRITYDGPESPVPASLDPSFFHQIFDNLIATAAEHAHGEAVTVRLSEENGDWIRVDIIDESGRDSEGADENALEVADTDVDRGDSDSVDLSLAVTEVLVQSMSGSVAVDSTPDGGTTLTVQLPRNIKMKADSRP